MQELIINGTIQIPEDKVKDFIDSFNLLLQNNSGQFHGLFQQGYKYDYAEIIEEIDENV